MNTAKYVKKAQDEIRAQIKELLQGRDPWILEGKEREDYIVLMNATVLPKFKPIPEYQNQVEDDDEEV